MYIPPFQISAEAINMIADISRLVERYAILLENDDGLRLRKANRIRTIHSSLAIAASTQAGNSGPFIDFMLKEIFETLRKHQGEELGTVSEKSSEIERKSSEKKEKSSEKILRIIEGNPKISASEIAKIIGISSRSIEKNIKKLRENGMIRRIGPDHGGYWEIVKEK